MRTKWHKPLIGAAAWLLLVLLYFPDSPLQLDYVRLILIAAPLLIVPLCQEMEGRNFWHPFVLGAFFAIGMLISAGALGFLLVLPWWIYSAWLTATVASEVLVDRLKIKGQTAPLVMQALRISSPFFLLVAASWAIADRLNWNPMGFDATIVLLTAVHFHYAGYTLTWLATRIATPHWTRWLILFGVVLVAIGITTSQYGLPAWIEITSVTILVVAAWRFSFSIWTEQGLFYKVGALALAGGMCLAMAYGWRYIYLFPSLNIPMMYAVHGSLNSLGFALPVVLGIYRRNRVRQKIGGNSNNFQA